MVDAMSLNLAPIIPTSAVDRVLQLLTVNAQVVCLDMVENPPSVRAAHRHDNLINPTQRLPSPGGSPANSDPKF
jgi:hypothetical protein